MLIGSPPSPGSPYQPAIGSGPQLDDDERKKLAAAYSNPPKTSADVTPAAIGPVSPIPADDPSAPGYADRVAGPSVTAIAPPPLPSFTPVVAPGGENGGVPIPPVAPAVRTTSNSDVSTTTTSSKPTAGEAVALGGVQNAIEERRAANNAVGAVGTAQAQAEVGSAGEAVDHLARREAETIALQKRRDDAYQRNQADERRLYDEYKKKSTEEVLPDGLGTQILSRLAMALGAYGSAVNGGPNQAAEIIKEKTRASYQKHKDAIENARQLYVDKHGMNAEADQHFDVLERDLNTRFAAGLDKLHAKGIQLQLQAGVPLAQVQADEKNAVLAQESAQLKVANEQLNREHVTKTINNRSVTVTDSGGPNGAGKKGGQGPIYFRDENGRVIGSVPSVREHAAVEKEDAAFNRAKEQLAALRDDIQKNRYALTPTERARRATLHHNAVIAVAAVSSLGKTDSSLKEEEGSIGDPNPILSRDATIGALNSKLKEVSDHQARVRREMLTPLPGAEQGSTDGGIRAPSQAGPQDDHQGAIQWLQNEGKKPENRAAAIEVLRKLKNSGVVQ